MNFHPGFVLRWLAVLCLALPSGAYPDSSPPGFDNARQRLARENAELAASRDPELVSGKLESIVRDMLVLVTGARGEGVVDAMPPTDLHYLSALWLPLQYSLPATTAGATALAEKAGLSSGSWGRDVQRDIFTLLTLLDLVDFRPEGTAELTAAAQALYPRLWDDARTNLGLSADAFSSKAFCAFTASQVQWRWPEHLSATSLVRASRFYVLNAAQAPEPEPAQHLLRALRRMALSPLSSYEDKRHVYRVLTDQMTRGVRRTDAEGAVASLKTTLPHYLLMCHAGIPLSAFKPIIDPPDAEGRRWCHFTGAYEEDLPGQYMFSEESCLRVAMTLRALLTKLDFKNFDPLQHVVLMNFDIAEDGQGQIVSLSSRRYGYMGYLDAFGDPRIPSILRSWSDREPSP